jgi:hypothetical protein
MLAKFSAALIYALFPRHPVDVKIVANDFLVNKCGDFIDIRLCGEAVIDDSRILVPGSLNKVMTDDQPMQKNIAIKRIRLTA